MSPAWPATAAPTWPLCCRPTLAVAAGKELICPTCGAAFWAPSAEELAFNSQGACEKCGGTGTVRTVNLDSLVPDDSLTIDGGAVAPWNSLMWSLMTDVCREMGVRTDVPFRELTEREKDIVFHGPAEKKHIFYHAKGSNQAGELDFTYFNAVYTVENALSKVKDEKGMKRVEKFLKEEVCPACHGTRLSAAARAPKLRGITLDAACTMTLSALNDWVGGVPASLPEELRPMAASICEAFTARPGGCWTWGWAISPWTAPPPPCPPGSGSGCSWPGRCATGPPGCSTCWMSPLSACTRPTSWASPE